MGKTKHGQCRRLGGGPTRTYSAWRAMRKRCNPNIKHPQRNDWAGRGITVCERWESFENFLKDMGECPPGLTLERRHNDKGYEKGNCEWATPAVQARNRRSTRHITFGGETMCLKDWAARFGLGDTTLAKRLAVASVAMVFSNPLPSRKHGLGRGGGR